MNTTPQKSYKIKEVSNILGCSVPTIYRLINNKKLKTFLVGADKRITAGEICRLQEGGQ